MANARVLTTDAEIDAAIAAARDLPPQPLATAVEYLRDLRVVHVELNTGQRLLIPAEELQHVSTAQPEQLRDIQIIEPGVGIDFTSLDVQFSIEGLLAGLRGNQKWMEHLRARREAALLHAA